MNVDILPSRSTSGALGASVNPYLIAATALALLAGSAVTHKLAFAPLVIVVAFLAGWSSAWSP
jgi:hypothetical protein